MVDDDQPSIQAFFQCESPKNLGSRKSGSLAICQTAWSAQNFSHLLFVDQHTPLTHKLAGTHLLEILLHNGSNSAGILPARFMKTHALQQGVFFFHTHPFLPSRFLGANLYHLSIVFFF